jgi:two-component system response regulator FixJ
MEHILVVAEECARRRRIAEILLGFGYEVDVAEDGKSAMAVLKRRRYDVVINENDLTGFDDVDLIRKIRSSGHIMPIIVAIQHLPRWESPQYPWLLSVTLLFKPYGREALLQALNTALRKPVACRKARPARRRLAG